MTNILIPMAGAGMRFADAGYKIHKPAIPVIYRKTGKEIPMVVASTLDLPGVAKDGSNIIYIDRDFHKKDGVENEIRNYFPKCQFITIGNLTQGQASSCLLAQDKIDNEEDLLIAGCDNGMVFDEDKFNESMQESDVLVFTYRNNEAVLENPSAYGWVVVDENSEVVDVSVKKKISDNPLKDHAIVATFWFKKGKYFVEMANKMIENNDRINNEFYVDLVIKYCAQNSLKTRVFEVERYICFGTPKDYEDYQNTIKYWRDFLNDCKI